MSDPKIQTVQEVYAAFGRGDVAAILERCTDDVDWASDSALEVAPWHGPHLGRGQVPHFFQRLAESTEVFEFSPVSFAANDTDVMVVVRFGVRSRTSGKSATMNLHHWWRFRDGKIAQYRGSEDTALTERTMSS